MSSAKQVAAIWRPIRSLHMCDLYLYIIYIIYLTAVNINETSEKNATWCTSSSVWREADGRLPGNMRHVLLGRFKLVPVFGSVRSLSNKRQAKKMVSNSRPNIKAEGWVFFLNLHFGNIFPKALVLLTKRICLHVDKRPNCVCKNAHVRVDKASVLCHINAARCRLSCCK